MLTAPPPDETAADAPEKSPEEKAADERAAKIAGVLSFIDEHRGGDMAVQLADRLADVTAAVRDVAGDGGKAKGTVTLTIEIEAVKGVAGGAVKVTDGVKSRPPVRKPEAEIRFGRGGSLLRDPVDQLALYGRPGGKR